MNKTPVPISFAKKFDCFTEQWSPKVVAEMNDYQFKLVRLEGEFVWHDHQDTDETFIVLEGKLVIDFQAGTVELEAGQMLVVPKGVPHRHPRPIHPPNRQQATRSVESARHTRPPCPPPEASFSSGSAFAC